MAQEEPKGRLRRLLRGLSRTRESLVTRLKDLTGVGTRLQEEQLEELEEILLAADCGVDVTMAVVDALRSRSLSQAEGEGALDLLRRELVACFAEPQEPPRGRPHVILLVGVNGSGKTTTAGKLAERFRAAGEHVVLAAADTYRAAAVEQLELWARRVGVELVAQKEGADPAAVVVDALRAAQARGADVVLADTAGRLHTREPLMRELEKIGRVAQREVPDAPHEVLLVMDAGTGQNGLAQARRFSASLPLTGLVLTKLDGTARGGIAVAVSRELGLPIRYIGVGETAEDLLPFSRQEYVDSLLASPGEG